MYYKRRNYGYTSTKWQGESSFKNAVPKTNHTRTCKIHNEIAVKRVAENQIQLYCISCEVEKEADRRRDYYVQNAKMFRKRARTEQFEAFLEKSSTGIIIYIFLAAIFGGYLYNWINTFLDRNDYELKFNIFVFDVILVIIQFLVVGTIALFVIQNEQKKSNTTEDYNSSAREQIERIREIEKHKVREFVRNHYQTYLEITSSIQTIDKLDGFAFEEFMASFFRRIGYNVQLTPASGDDGLDLIISRKGTKIGVQCKRYKNKVNNSAIQEAYSGKDFYDCDEALVVTNSWFTEPARNLAEKLNVALWDRTVLIKELSIIQEDLSWNDYMSQYYDFRYFELSQAKKR
ncbi:restriction endonuclease [Cohnella boryungensis]|uniref:Restriction endonuclease n=1 Tax=Cohnella boryungensis TaxID=768479 RepID=A0ABV8SDX2_9BACL